MKQEIATLWVDALRSGKYPQTTGVLEVIGENDVDQVGFCCLGVLASLAVDAGVIYRSVSGDYLVNYGTDGDVCMGDLPNAVQRWAGMRSADGRRDNTAYYQFRTGEYRDSLMGLNDTKGYTFAQIADVIEAEYETL